MKELVNLTSKTQRIKADLSFNTHSSNFYTQLFFFLPTTVVLIVADATGTVAFNKMNILTHVLGGSKFTMVLNFVT